MNESGERLGARGEVYRLLSRAYYTPEADFLKGEFSGLFLKVFSILALDSSNKEIEDMERYLESLKEPLELAHALFLAPRPEGDPTFSFHDAPYWVSASPKRAGRAVCRSVWLPTLCPSLPTRRFRENRWAPCGGQDQM